MLLTLGMDCLLDTNIIVIYSRDNNLSKKLEEKYKLFSGNNRLFVSVVTLGEIDAFVKKFGLGNKRKAKILEILQGVNKIGLNFQEVISRFGDIDCF